MKSNPAQNDISYILMKLEPEMISCAKVSHFPHLSLHLDEEQETHQVVVGVSAAALHDVHVLAPHRIVDVHVRLSCNQGSEHKVLMS